MINRKKPYYSIRTGKNPLVQGFNLDSLKESFKTLFLFFEKKGYFQESFGYYCIDRDFVPGTLGHNLEGALLLELCKKNLTPINERIGTYTEDDLFDVIEFLYDYCSKPVEEDGRYHSYGDCGWHYSKFVRDPGQLEYRERINK